jgi:hypothetical protein
MFVSMKMPHQGFTVTPVVSLPQVSVMVLRLQRVLHRLAHFVERSLADARLGPRAYVDGVVVEEHVLRLAQ